MEIRLQNSLQHEVADLLWRADSSDVQAILAKYGVDAQIVYNMMLASIFDDIDDTELANAVLQDIFTD